jgi:NDP-sugar pyrophosphorylase family protein
MFPLSTIMEKSLLPVDGRPVIRHIVDKLKKSKNVKDIHICCLHKFRKHFEHEFRDEEIDIIGFEKPEGTYTTWFSALYEIDRYDSKEDNNESWSMVHYADCMTDIDYDDFISKIDPKYDGVIAVTNTVKHDYSEVSITKNDNIVQDFVEKPNVMNYSWSGIGLFFTPMVEGFYNGQDGQDFAFDIFPQMIKQKKLKAYPYRGYWYDMGNLNSYRKVCALYDNNNDGEKKK